MSCRRLRCSSGVDTPGRPSAAWLSSMHFASWRCSRPGPGPLSPNLQRQILRSVMLFCRSALDPSVLSVYLTLLDRYSPSSVYEAPAVLVYLCSPYIVWGCRERVPSSCRLPRAKYDVAFSAIGVVEWSGLMVPFVAPPSVDAQSLYVHIDWECWDH